MLMVASKEVQRQGETELVRVFRFPFVQGFLEWSTNHHFSILEAKGNNFWPLHGRKTLSDIQTFLIFHGPKLYLSKGPIMITEK